MQEKVVPEVFKPLYEHGSGLYRDYVFYGGRGGGKSWEVADYLLIKGVRGCERVLCCREVQKSIKQSVHQLFSDRIKALGLEGFYLVLETEIRGLNGTKFSFTGLLQHTVDSIKSFEGTSITWIEEAQTVSGRSLAILIPTVIRTKNPQIIYTLNPRLPKDAVYEKYIINKPDDAYVALINYTDNKNCPQTLIDEAEAEMKRDFTKYECIWLGKVQQVADGAVYKKELECVAKEKRLCKVPYDKLLPVHTVWDLGVGDATVIWFVQIYGKEVRLIDYIENNNNGMPFYISVLKSKEYNYGKHFAPHDIEVREFGTGKSRIETARELGMIFEKTPNIALEDGIEAARSILPNCYFDEEKTKDGVYCLQNYERDYSEHLGEFKMKPKHNWASHAADAFRYLAININKMMERKIAPKPVSRANIGYI